MKVELSYVKNSAVTRVKTVEMDVIPAINDRMFAPDTDGVTREVVVTHRYFDVAGKVPFIVLWMEDFE
jgi:hypothetical protein